MATINAIPGTTTAFSGGDDDLICRLPSASRSGITISCKTLLLNACTIEASAVGGDPDTIDVSGAVHNGVIGEGMLIDYVRISGAAEGSYQVTIA